MAIAVATLSALAGCSKNPCEKMSDRYRECAGDVNAPASAFASVGDYCFAAMLPVPELAEGERPSMAHEMQAALQPCLEITGCDELNACLERAGCAFVLENRYDRTPEFNCFGPAPASR